jgi:chlorophyll synthase
LFRRIDRTARRRDWDAKIADLSLFVGFALAVSNATAGRLATGCLLLAASAALAAFGYAWNDVCDAGADERAGKGRPLPSESKSTALFALAVAVVLFAAAARLDPVLIAVAVGGVVLAWAYSAAPIRLKERGWLGLLGGAVAQRTVPAVFITIAFDISIRDGLPWLVWMTCWGLRGMITHQVRDADADRIARLRTWAAQASAKAMAYRLVALLLAAEASSFCLGLLPLLRHGSVLVAAVIALAAWLVLTAGVVAQARTRPEPLDWFVFRRLPLADLYGVFAPLVVAVALLRLEVWPASAWVAVDALVRVPAVRRLWRATSGLRAYGGAETPVRTSG